MVLFCPLPFPVLLEAFFKNIVVGNVFSEVQLVVVILAKLKVDWFRQRWDC